MPALNNLRATIALLLVLAGAVAARAQSAGPTLEAVFENAEVLRQMQTAFARVIFSGVPDPKGEFAGFLPKAGFVIALERGQPRLRFVENPDVAFLRRLAALHKDPDGADKLPRYCREEEPDRTRKISSYTVRRVLERLEWDGIERRLAPEARTSIARAVIEEMTANGSIDPANHIEQTIQASIARPRLTQRQVLAYGFTLVESATPGEKEWRALSAKPQLFCVRFSTEGFTIFRVTSSGESRLSYRPRGWRAEASALLKALGYRHSSPGKVWMGFSME